ncbi:MAG: aldehyde dehydrogenase [Flavobacteriaceae bacterium]|nr:aldehyde dehydrogenase [Flavobacteriaceae bacterium]
MDFSNYIENQENYFRKGNTLPISKRKKLLKNLKKEILSNEDKIFQALNNDLRKSNYETYLTEIGILISEIDLFLSNLKKWAKPKKVKSSLLSFPSSDYIYSEPYGKVLIISPWNYPFQLAVLPLMSAVAAGNTVVLKPSEHAPNTSSLIKEIIEKIFDKSHALVVEGAAETASKLLEYRWDYIFFTGSVKIGKIVATAAAKHLTPTTLELGGKNPCIIDDSVDLRLTSRRIVWGKFVNAGQTCIAPDFLIVKRNIKEQLVDHLSKEIERAYGKDPKESEDYPRIVNKTNLSRLSNMIKDTKILFGGEYDIETCYFSPTIIDEPRIDSPIMDEEIFGPILPIISYDDENQIEKLISKYEKPLALYVFSTNKIFSEKIIRKYSFGGGAINDTIIHVGNPNLPFGGVGYSGIGAYHGKSSFDLLSHKKSIVKKGNWLDIKIRYAPYKGKLEYVKKFFKLFS